MKWWRVILILVAFAALWYVQAPGSRWDHGAGPERQADRDPQVSTPATPRAASRDAAALPAFLPAQAHDTLALITRSGPFPHRQDGAVFQNRERLLPAQPRGYYREYTVRTPGERTRGARRIVTGGDPPREFWYTADHYASFRRFEVPR
jgi:ribonuclease T1